MFRRDDDEHTETHVEDVVHFGVWDAAELLDEAEDGQNGPTAQIEFCAQAIGKDARRVVDEAAARDVGESVNVYASGPQLADLAEVGAMNGKQCFADCLTEVWMRVCASLAQRAR